MIGFLIFVAFFAYCTCSFLYVFRYRGATRYESFSEYFRKGWPIFTPLNCLLYLSTKKRARKPICNTSEFPELQLLKDNWETIREEGINLVKTGYFDSISDPDQASYYDVGFRTFYKYGWSKFYLTWYGGHTHKSALRLCPKTVEMVKQVPSINGTMFTLLPPGSKLTRHLDPAACSLRYHLGLETPNDERCFINVDGKTHVWQDGEDFLFDETFIHFVRNDSDASRLILMCDVERPLGLFGKIVNFFYKTVIRLTIVPNTTEDHRGFANRFFHWAVPTIQRIKGLKEKNKVLYQMVKWSINLSLCIILILPIYLILQLLF